MDNEIVFNGERVAIDGDIEISIFSPFMDREERVLANGSKINPQGLNGSGISKTSTGDLQKLIGHADKLQVKNQAFELSGVTLLSEGVAIDEGNLSMENIRHNLNTGVSQFRFNFYSKGTDDFLRAIENKTLKDLALDGVVNIAAPNLSNWGRVIDSDPTHVLQREDFTSLAASGPEPRPVPPYPHNDIFADQGYAVHAGTAKHATDIINNGSDYYTFPTLLIYTNQTDDEGNKIMRVANRWGANNRFNTYQTEIVSTIYGNVTTYRALDNAIVPMFYYKKVLLSIFAEHGYELVDDKILEDSQFVKLVILNTYSILNRVTAIASNIHNIAELSKTILYYEDETVIDPVNHLPAVNLVDFLGDFMQKFNVYFEAVGNKVYIRYNELEVTQGEITRFDPNIEIEIQQSRGLTLKYDLGSNDAYIEEAKIAKPYTAMPAEAEPGELYLDASTNLLYKEITAGDEIAGCNLIPYNSGEGKQYTMVMSPVNQRPIDYNLVLGNDPFPLGAAKKALLPFVFSDVSGPGLTTHYYTMTTVTGTSNLGVWKDTHTYEYNESEEQAPIAAEDLQMLGFYHGLEKTMDIVPYAISYPYMSNHHYVPGAAVPKVGDWHLGIIGPEGIIEYWYRTFVNVFNSARKVILGADVNIEQVKKHRWNQSTIIRGAAVYLSNIRFKAPLRNYVIIECYEL